MAAMTGPLRRSGFAGAALLAALLLSSHAAAAGGDQGCEPNQPPNMIISGCSALLQNHEITADTVYEVLFLRGEAYAAEGDDQHAIEDFDQSIKLKPDFAGAFLQRGNAYFKLGKFNRAIADYSQAVNDSSDFLDAFEQRGLAYERIGDKPKAIADFRSVLKIAPFDETAKAELKKLGG